MELKGAVVVVTGAARGLGAEIAAAFAARGARVAAADVLEEPLTATAGRIRAAGGQVLPLRADVTSPEDVEAMVATVQRELGAIDVQINNAGTFSVIAPVWQCPVDRWLRDVRTNLFGSFLCCRAAARGMVERGRGYILNIVSAGGVGDPHPYCTSYASSKAGLMRLTEGLARELEPHGVKVFAIAPPAIRTAMTEFIVHDPGGRKWRPGFERVFQDGRDAPPTIVAELALNLVSGRADRLTGRYFLATADFEGIVARTDEILAQDLMTLRIRS
jgi:NAD(P)-dependent dehydrogenase (short-subunit alcohol dehydrogenase family)